MDARSKAWEVALYARQRQLRMRGRLLPDQSRDPLFLVAYLMNPVPEAVFTVLRTTAAWDDRKEPRAAAIHDIFGNPFRPVAFEPTWRTATVTSLADAIYAERAFDRLPILADALEDAGCTAAGVLEHCRQPGEHVRGCWVVDLVLGKA